MDRGIRGEGETPTCWVRSHLAVFASGVNENSQYASHWSNVILSNDNRKFVGLQFDQSLRDSE